MFKSKTLPAKAFESYVKTIAAQSKEIAKRYTMLTIECSEINAAIASCEAWANDSRTANLEDEFTFYGEETLNRITMLETLAEEDGLETAFNIHLGLNQYPEKMNTWLMRVADAIEQIAGIMEAELIESEQPSNYSQHNTHNHVQQGVAW